MRLDIDERTRRLAEELKTSDEMRERGEELKEQILAHPEVRAWSSSLWTRLKAALIEATEDPESDLRAHLEQALVEAGRSLQSDPELRAKVDRWIVDATSYGGRAIPGRGGRPDRHHGAGVGQRRDRRSASNSRLDGICSSSASTERSSAASPVLRSTRSPSCSRLRPSRGRSESRR